MTLEAQAVAEAALNLDPADRLALATMLLDSVEEPPDPTWEEAWTAELRRRSAAADGRGVRGAPWSEVRARLLRELAER